MSGKRSTDGIPDRPHFSLALLQGIAERTHPETEMAGLIRKQSRAELQETIEEKKGETHLI
jgi:hypothetical protein